MKLSCHSMIIPSLALGFLAVALPVNAQIPPPENPEEVLSDAYPGKSYSPYAGRGFASRPFWEVGPVDRRVTVRACRLRGEVPVEAGHADVAAETEIALRLELQHEPIR